MTIKDVIDHVDKVKPNGFSADDKIKWLAELEGKIQTEILLIPLDELVKPETMSDELIVPYPYDSIYNFWLQAMVDFHNGEYDRYDNTYAMFNEKWKEYARWRTTHYPTKGDLARGVTMGGLK